MRDLTVESRIHSYSIALCSATRRAKLIRLGDVTETNRTQAPKQKRPEAGEVVLNLFQGCQTYISDQIVKLCF